MFDNLQNTQVQVMSEEDMLAATGQVQEEGTDDKGKKKAEKKVDKKETGNTEPKNIKNSDLKTALGEDDEEEAAELDEDEDDIDGEEKKKAEQVDNNDEDEDDINDEKNKKDKDNEGEPLTDQDFLKARVALLIKKGEWEDFEGSDEVEWDEDNFADMELQQRAHQKEKLKEEVLESFGPYGSKIAEYSANGGDPDKLIDIFKEQQRVENLAVDTEDNQKLVVFKHMTQFQGKSADSANRYIKSLIADNALEAEAKEAKDLMESDLKAQEEELQDAQKTQIQQARAAQKANLEKFSKDVTTLLAGRKDIDPTEKKELTKLLTVFNKQLKNGTPVNEFYFKFAEFRKDLPNYLEMVRFINNPEKYKKSVSVKAKNEQVEKDFKLIRKGNQTGKNKSTNPEAGGTEKKSTFKLLY